jgi:hypothetical protein
MKNINKKSINSDIISRKSLLAYQRNQDIKNMIVWSAQAIAISVVAIMFIDFMGFMAWIISGQNPDDGLYIGSITTNLLKIIL